MKQNSDISVQGVGGARNTNMEEEILLDDTTRFTVLVGEKGSGKTIFLLSWIYFYLFIGAKGKTIVDEFHLVLPSFLNEEKGSYRFLTDPRWKKKVFVYERFDPMIIEMIKRKKKPEQRFFLAIDDATGFGDEFKSPAFFEFVTTIRHQKIDLVVVAHALKAVVWPVIRNNMDRVFSFSVSYGLAEYLFDEFVRGKFYNEFPKKDDWIRTYHDRIWVQQFKGVLLKLNPAPPVLDWDLDKWVIVGKFLKYKEALDKIPIVEERRTVRQAPAHRIRGIAPLSEQPESQLPSQGTLPGPPRSTRDPTRLSSHETLPKDLFVARR